MSSNAERVEIYSGIQRGRRYAIGEQLRVLQGAPQPGTALYEEIKSCAFYFWRLI